MPIDFWPVQASQRPFKTLFTSTVLTRSIVSVASEYEWVNHAIPRRVARVFAALVHRVGAGGLECRRLQLRHQPLRKPFLQSLRFQATVGRRRDDRIG